MRTESVQYLSEKSTLTIIQTLDYKMYPMYERFMTNKFAKDRLIVMAIPHFMKLVAASKLKSTPEELVAKILVRLDSIDIKKLIAISISLNG